MEKRTSLWQIRKWKWSWGLETSDPDFEDRDFQKIWWAVLEGQHADESRLGLATDDSESGKITPTRKGKSPKHGVSVFEGFSMEFTRLGPEKGNRLLYSLNILVWRTSGVKWQPNSPLTSLPPTPYLSTHCYSWSQNIKTKRMPLHWSWDI